MIIKDISALKAWLQFKLKGICQADPHTLSQYVIALVKKDKPEANLKKACLDQLDVFLQDNTVEFVESLFNSINTESYLLVDCASNVDVSKQTIKPDSTSPPDDTPMKSTDPFSSELPADLPSSKHKSDHSKSRTHRRRSSSSSSTSRSRNSSKRYTEKSRSRSRSASPSMNPKRYSYRSSTKTSGSEAKKTSSSADITTQISKPSKKTRCRDFDERGFCVRGDLCSYDHGAAPLVIKNKNVNNLVPIEMVPLPPPPSVPANMTVPPPFYDIGSMPHYQPTPVVSAPSYHRPFHYPAPSISSNIISIAPTPSDTNKEASVQPTSHKSNLQYEPTRPQMSPPQNYTSTSQYGAFETNDTDNIADHVDPSAEAARANRSFYPPSDRGSRRGYRGYHHSRGALNGHPGKRKYPFGEGSSSLLVFKLPLQLNNVGKLNEHFQEFGTITNIQICYRGQTDAALIEFSSSFEAQSAYRSPAPIFSNRFIRTRILSAAETGTTTQSTTGGWDGLSGDVSETPSLEDDPMGEVPKKKFIGRLGGVVPMPLPKEEKRMTIPAFSDDEDENKNQSPEANLEETCEWNEEAAFSERKRKKQEEALKMRQKQLEEYEKRQAAKLLHQKRVELLDRYRKELKTLLERHSTSTEKAEKRQLQVTIKEMNTKMVELEAQLQVPVKPPAVAMARPTRINRPMSAEERTLRQEIECLGIQIRAKKAANEDIKDDLRMMADLKRQLVDMESAAFNGGKPGRFGAQSSRELTKLDKRSRCVFITGHSSDETDDIHKLLVNSRFELEKFEKLDSETEPVIAVTFGSRQQAEMAVRAVTKFRGNDLTLSFSKPTSLIEMSDMERGDTNGGASGRTAAEVLDDDEDDATPDAEDRSWRH